MNTIVNDAQPRTPRDWPKRLGLPLAMFLPLFTACGSQQGSELEGVRAPERASISRVTFNKNEHHPLGEQMFVIKTLSKKLERNAANANPVPKFVNFAVRCNNLNSPDEALRSQALSKVGQIARAFGLDIANARQTTGISYKDLNTRDKFTEQPILDCDFIGGPDTRQHFSQLYKIVRSGVSAEDVNLPNYMVRFGLNDPENETFDQNTFYSVGCMNFVDLFASKQQKEQAVPLLDTTASAVFPNIVDYKEINCNEAQTTAPQPMTRDQLPRWSSKPIAGTNTGLVVLKDVETEAKRYFLKTTDTILMQDSKNVPQVSSEAFVQIACYLSTEADLLKAFDFSPGYKPLTLYSDSNKTAYQAVLDNANRRPSLRCVDPFDDPTPLTKAYETVNDQPTLHYFQADNGPVLFRFGCDAAKSFFGGDVLSRMEITAVTRETLSLPEFTEAGAQIMTVPCFDNPFPADKIESIYRDVLNKNPGAAEISAIQREIKAQGSDPNTASVTLIVIQKYFNDYLDLDRVISEAMVAVFRRDPEDREKIFLRDWIAQDQTINSKKLRRHYAELVAHLRSLNNLPLADYKRSFREVLGYEAGPGDNDYWYPRLLSEPGLMKTYADAEKQHFNFIECCFKDRMLDLVVKKVYATWSTVNESDRKQIKDILSTGYPRPHYQELVNYINKNPLIPLDRDIRVESVFSGKVMQVKDAGVAFSEIQQGTFRNQDHQKWRIYPKEGGLYELRPVYQNRSFCLTVFNGIKDPGALVKVSDCSRAHFERWQLSRTAINGFILKDNYTGNVLDVYGATKDEGASIRSHPQHGGENQRWFLY